MPCHGHLRVNFVKKIYKLLVAECQVENINSIAKNLIIKNFQGNGKVSGIFIQIIWQPYLHVVCTVIPDEALAVSIRGTKWSKKEF